MDLRDEANASVLREELRDEVREEVRGEVWEEVRGEVREEVRGEVREEVAKEVTEQMVIKGVCKTYKILTSVGADRKAAIQAIMKEYDMPQDQVLSILQKA